MNAYGMELYAATRLEEARKDAATRRLVRTARGRTEGPSRWRRWLRLDRGTSAGRKAGLARAS
jgi:hypothetical protein